MSIESQSRPQTYNTSPPLLGPETAQQMQPLTTIQHYSRALVARLFLPRNKSPELPPTITPQQREILIDHMINLIKKEEQADTQNDQEHHSHAYYDMQSILEHLQDGFDPNQIRIGLLRRKLATRAFDFPQILATYQTQHEPS